MKLRAKAFTRGVCAVMFAMLLTFGASAQTNAVEQTITQTITVPRNTRAYAEIRAFLIRESAGNDSYDSADLDAAKLGDFTIQSFRHYKASAGTVMPLDENDPPVTPPSGGGQPGDTWSVSTCSSGVSQTWTWTFEQYKGWVMTGYSMQRRSSCGPNTTFPPHNA